jgi:FtsZ-interacting cell division protein ZipA
MSTLQLALIVAGVVLVVGVIIYNAWQERRLRRRIAAAFTPENKPAEHAATQRVEPTLGGHDARLSAAEPPPDATPAVRPPTELPASPFTIPMDDVTLPPADADDASASDAAYAEAGTEATAAVAPAVRSIGPQPDPDIECMVRLAPVHPVAASALQAGVGARLGKPLRWFARTRPSGPWQLIGSDTSERFVEVVACLLLADRNGALSQAQLSAFLRLAGEIGTSIDATVTAPDAQAELARAEALDRLCADLDVQIGLTVLKPDPGSVPGTRLRGVAEAAGFQLAPGGRFEHLQEDTGAVLYTLHNMRNEPFTAESLRITATNGVVFVLDVARVSDPPRAFDQMKMAAKRMAHNLGAELVDDNRRPLDDAALAKIRSQVQAAADALAEVHIEPGSPRALALFGA